MGFGQGKDLPSIIDLTSARSCQKYLSRHAWILCSLGLTLIANGMPAHSAEPRRCLRDGQVIITNAPCELLGNATELNPVPEKHFKRGEPAPKTIIPPQAVKAEPTKLVASQPTPSQIADTAIQQMIKTLITNLLLPVALISALVVWLKRRTRLAAQGIRREPHAALRVGAQPATGGSDPRPAHTNLEPFVRDTAVASQDPKPTAWSLELIRDLEWKRFEDVCQQYYERKGIRSETTPLGPDGGIDIRLYQDDSGKATAIVQCKAWGDRIVGVNLIRELLGVMTHEKIGKAFFMTSGRYSDEAKATAEANRITLIDGPMLLEMFRRLLPADQNGLLAFATTGDYRTPTCPRCGVKMVRKAGATGKPDFWGCSAYPRCRQTLGMRQRQSLLFGALSSSVFRPLLPSLSVGRAPEIRRSAADGAQ